MTVYVTRGAPDAARVLPPTAAPTSGTRWLLWQERGRRPRLLFLAHRRELLRQASERWRQLLREQGDTTARIGWFVDDASNLSAHLVFASVAKLARREHVARLAREAFDYVVVDEVHHAAAESYRRILAAVDPEFLLGLTATPDRTDAADVLGLFDDHVAYRADMARGVEIQRLVPFHYFGVRDEIDYENIPWRNRRFDPDALARAAETEARMETLWRAWRAHPGARSLVFCCSIAHARFVRAWLAARDVRVAAVFSGEGSDDRDTALADLAAGTIDAVCAVDVFNEGVDVPSIDRVVMLRPTESGVVFLQQLGRGLRASDDKTHVTVIDFVGNHRVFLERVRTLLSLGGASDTASLRTFLARAEPTELPAGCRVEIELEAKALLATLFQVGGADEVERAYRELRAERGQRPTAGELHRMGYSLERVRGRYGGWFEFVRSERDLAPDEEAALAVAGEFLRALESPERMTRSFKMILLEAMLESDALVTGMTVRDAAVRSHAILRRDPDLFGEVADDERVEVLDETTEPRWIAYWKKNPIAAWTSAKAPRRAWLKLVGDRLALNVTVPPASRDAVARLTRELVDYRLAQYRERGRQRAREGFVCRVTWNKRDPILMLPPRTSNALPEGEVAVRVPKGDVWLFRFAEVACNVARPVGTQTNRLPDLLREWFGPSAGRPGTAFQVRFYASPDGLWVEPVQASALVTEARRGVAAYPELRAAAGHGVAAAEAPEVERVVLPLARDDADLFAVRVAGSSMDGGKTPMRNGDWAVLRLVRGAPVSTLANRVVLAQIAGEAFGSRYHLKRLTPREGGWALTSDNPDGPTLVADQNTVPIARLEQVVRPEDLAPAVGSVRSEHEIAAAFGIEEMACETGRHGGHLFVFVQTKDVLVAPDELRVRVERLRPAETAYAFAKSTEGQWRYLGVARRREAEDAWEIPEVDYATWRRWGSGREVSRRLPDDALAQAQRVVSALLALDEAARTIEQGGRVARVLGASERGGLRVDGGQDGFGPRTVSLTDIAWVAVAAGDVQANGGVLDEERVNRVRYLEGTPRASTRWIDTGWALAAWQRAEPWIAGAEVPR